VGSIAYYRSRHEMYSITTKPNPLQSRRRKRLLRYLGLNTNAIDNTWKIFLLLNSFFYFVVASQICKSLLYSAVFLPPWSKFIEFTILGFVPLHFFPQDRLYIMLNENRIHRVLVRIVWGLTKARSLHGLIHEAVEAQSLTFISCCVLSFISCQAARLLSKLDVMLLSKGLQPTILRMKRTVASWPELCHSIVTSKSFIFSVVLSLLVAHHHCFITGYTFQLCFHSLTIILYFDVLLA
jgi:hypothetical protein